MIMNRLSKIGVISVLLLVFVQFSKAQDGLRFFDDRAMEGYMLYQSDNSAVLVDNCGNLVHEWTEVAARFHPKLQPNGHLIYIEIFSEKIIEKDWDDNIVNEINVSNNNIEPDYEVILLDNGNYLCIGRRSFSISDFVELGYDYGGSGVGTPSQVDVVMELDRNTGNIVWLWDISDHVIQERDSNAGNFGDVSEHPELFNMDAIATFDWTFEESFMINGFDYNPDLDQIALSIRKMSEVVIIDHSTTTEEAAGHTGGDSGKGGDILYRWGNPQNYGRGSAGNRKLFFQHNPNWIQYGEHAGKIIMYNNGLGGPFFSTAPIIDPPIDSDGNYSLQNGQPFEPSSPELDYGNNLGEDFFSGYTSAAKVLANGNILITVGGDDRVLEMLPDGTLVWEYGLVDPGLTFRVEKYAIDYAAFEGKNLVAGEVLEFPESDVPCTIVDISENYFNETRVWLSNSNVFVDTNIEGELLLSITSIEGKLLMQNKLQSGDRVDVSDLVNGIYLVSLIDPNKNLTVNYKVFR